MTHLIGIAGGMRSGKNTVADMLTQIGGYIQYSFAHRLRKEIAEILNSREIPEDYPPFLIPYVKKYFGKPYKVWEKPTEDDMRVILQRHGTEYRREKYGTDYWVNACMNDIFMLPKVVITDVRFENEHRAIREDGGELWLVRRNIRDGVCHDDHISEQYVLTLGPHNVDRVIDNDGSLEDLYRKVEEALQCRRCHAAV